MFNSSFKDVLSYSSNAKKTRLPLSLANCDELIGNAMFLNTSRGIRIEYKNCLVAGVKLRFNPEKNKKYQITFKMKYYIDDGAEKPFPIMAINYGKYEDERFCTLVRLFSHPDEINSKYDYFDKEKGYQFFYTNQVVEVPGLIYGVTADQNTPIYIYLFAMNSRDSELCSKEESAELWEKYKKEPFTSEPYQYADDTPIYKGTRLLEPGEEEILTYNPNKPDVSDIWEAAPIFSRSKRKSGWAEFYDFKIRERVGAPKICYSRLRNKQINTYVAESRVSLKGQTDYLHNQILFPEVVETVGVDNLGCPKLKFSGNVVCYSEENTGEGIIVPFDATERLEHTTTMRIQLKPNTTYRFKCYLQNCLLEQNVANEVYGAQRSYYLLLSTEDGKCLNPDWLFKSPYGRKKDQTDEDFFETAAAWGYFYYIFKTPDVSSVYLIFVADNQTSVYRKQSYELFEFECEEEE